MNSQNHASLDLLDSLISGGSQRSKMLLHDPDSAGNDGWYMCVPKCFNDALDIKFNCTPASPGWTQSTCFSFKGQDTIYDTPKAHQVWSAALQEIGFSVVVQSAASAGQGPVGSGCRYSGNVGFAVCSPTEDKAKLARRFTTSLSQDDFVRFLIAGPSDDLRQTMLDHGITPRPVE